MAKLDDADARTRVLDALESGASRDDAAAAAGLSRRALYKYAASHADFRQQLDAAAMRGKQLAHHGARLVERGIIEPEVVSDEDAREAAAQPGHIYSRDEYLQRLTAVASNDQHPACAAALRIFGAWHLEAEMMSSRKRAEREESAGALEAARPDDVDARDRLLALVEARRKGADVVVG